MTKNKGFTLIELMIVVAVIAIIAAVAIPAYSDYVTRSKRADGKTALVAMQLEQEKYRANNPEYASTAAILGFATASPDGYYTLSVSSANASSYSLVADPIEAEHNDPVCNNLVINQDGDKNATGNAADPVATCWQR